jgi:hypothetical protein
VLAAVILAAAAVAVAPSAAADDGYLQQLHDRYNFLTVEQLAAESDRVCALTRAGQNSPTVVNVVLKDLGVSTQAALDIESAAVVNHC